MQESMPVLRVCQTLQRGFDYFWILGVLDRSSDKSSRSLIGSLVYWCLNWVGGPLQRDSFIVAKMRGFAMWTN